MDLDRNTTGVKLSCVIEGPELLLPRTKHGSRGIMSKLFGFQFGRRRLRRAYDSRLSRRGCDTSGGMSVAQNSKDICRTLVEGVSKLVDLLLVITSLSVFYVSKIVSNVH